MEDINIKKEFIHPFQHIDGVEDVQTYINLLDFEESEQSIKAYKKESYELLSLKPGDSVLEIGCGLGTDARTLASQVGPTGRVIALDKSKRFLEVAAQRTDLPNVEFRHGDVNALDFEDNLFSACYSNRVFKYIENPLQAISEMARVTKKGGKIFIAEVDTESKMLIPHDEKIRSAIMSVTNRQFPQSRVALNISSYYDQCGLKKINTLIRLLSFDGWNKNSGFISQDTINLLNKAIKLGLISQLERDHYIQACEEAEKKGIFKIYGLLFLIVGEKA